MMRMKEYTKAELQEAWDKLDKACEYIEWLYINGFIHDMSKLDYFNSKKSYIESIANHKGITLKF